MVSAYFGLTRGTQARQEGLTSARRALALRPDLPEALTAVAGLELICENDGAAAERHFAQALLHNPSYVQARCWYALFYLQWTRGRYEDGVAELRRALELDPLSAYVSTVLAVGLWQAGLVGEAVESATRAIGLDPDFVPLRSDHRFASLVQALDTLPPFYKRVASPADAVQPARPGLGSTTGPRRDSTIRRHLTNLTNHRDDGSVVA